MQHHLNTLLAIAVIVFSFSAAEAQNTSPYWIWQGINATTSSKLGTTNSINLRL